jgi:hypothetical protein
MGAPLSVFDSWNLLRAPERRFLNPDFFLKFRQIVDAALKAKHPTFLNIYFDPSHVVGFDGFEECLQYLSLNSDEIWIGTYADILSSD